MTFKDFMAETRRTFREDLNVFLSGKGLTPVRVLDSSLSLEKAPLSLAVYPTASSGSTVEEQAETATVRFTVQIYCNGEATEKGLAQGEEYYSSILEFIQSRTFGEFSSVDGSVLCRMDDGYVVNGAVYLVSSRFTTGCDYGW